MLNFMRPAKIKLPPPLREFGAIFAEHGKTAFLAGGAVRDMLRGKPSSDWDVATDAAPNDVIALFRSVIPTGLKHGTVTVRYKGHFIEVTTFRTEADYHDGRHPSAVRFAATIEEDLSRRDFTMNAIAAELLSGRLVDPFNGIGDIRRRLVRCVGDPLERFGEDGLRPLRALRFAATLGFSLDSALLAAIPKRLDVTAKVSAERIAAEFEKIIMSDNPAAALEAMRETGLLKLLIPELVACAGVEQKGYHRFDVWTHSVLACSYAAAHSMSKLVRFAALFHDIGKPAAARRGDDGVWTFYNHERVSAELAGAVLTRLRFPTAFIKDVTHLIQEHMFHYEDVWSDAAVRRFLIRVGDDNIKELFDLRAADTYGTAETPPPPEMLLPFCRRIETVRAKSSALSLRNLAVNGRDLAAEGVPAGKRIGIILNQLFEAVLDDPALNTRDALLAIARNLLRQMPN